MWEDTRDPSALCAKPHGPRGLYIALENENEKAPFDRAVRVPAEHTCSFPKLPHAGARVDDCVDDGEHASACTRRDTRRAPDAHESLPRWPWADR
eukprot:6166971-Prymnesium_polylepis.2